ncbi:hypothetical protein KBD45_02485, partial [Candidatus Dojkabacteria bacterium]|nr:hypothetical protein [Candidatus Dojkabacteria bacterium]
MQKYKIAIISMLALTIPVSLYTVSAANNSIPGQGLYTLDNQLYEITKAYMTSTQGDRGKAIALKAELEENLREIEAFQASKNRSINDYKTAYDSFTKKYQELDSLEKKYKNDNSFVELDLSRSLIKYASQYYAISYPFLGEIKNDPALYNLVFESLNTVTDYAYEINSQRDHKEGITDDMDPKTKAKTLLDQAFSDYNDLVDINTFGIQLNEDQKQKTTDSIDIIAGYYEQASTLFDNGEFDEVAKLSNKIIEEKENIFTILDLDEEIDGFNNIMTLDFMKI